ncbi:MAG: phosphate ABC transporter permease PstA [Syntrophomonadaceae bacterium]|nr:phosphate ABC transporter permease PstA [Syntrophomonadaceae bacterium]
MLNPKQEEKFWRIILWMIALATVLLLTVIIVHIVSRGIGSISWSFLSENPRHMGRDGGILPVLVGTLYLVAVSLLLAVPIGIGAAIYLTEYVRQGRLVSLIRFSTEALAGIPSIIFGLFGFVFFVIQLQLGWSVISGSLTLALMILPTIVRTSEEAIRSVPLSYREGSYALGASRWQTVSRVVLPSAVPGITVGVILGLGRAVGETAAVLLTAGSSLHAPSSLVDPARSLAVHLYILASEGISMQRAYATATILVIAVLMINLLANLVMRRMASRHVA